MIGVCCPSLHALYPHLYHHNHKDDLWTYNSTDMKAIYTYLSPVFDPRMNLINMRISLLKEVSKMLQLAVKYDSYSVHALCCDGKNHAHLLMGGRKG